MTTAYQIINGRKYYTTEIKGGERFEIGDRIRVEVCPKLKTNYLRNARR